MGIPLTLENAHLRIFIIAIFKKLNGDKKYDIGGGHYDRFWY